MNFDKTHLLEMTIHDSALINSKIHYASKISDDGKKTLCEHVLKNGSMSKFFILYCT